MSLGLCCQWLSPKTKRDGTVIYENAIDEKSMQLGRFKSGAYSEEYIRNVYRHNVDETIKIIPTIAANNIKCFRLTSNLFSLWEFNNHIPKEDTVLQAKLKYAGELFLKNNIRVTCHPGQFTVLSSDDDNIVAKSIMELDYHAWIFDQMNLPQTPFYAINVHGGKSDRINRLTQSINSLPQNIRNRLTLENDESSYNITDLLQVHDATGVPIVWDSHHHTFNTSGLSQEDAYQLAIMSWDKSGCKPLQHISNTIPGQENGSYTERRKHSDYIHYVPQCQLNGLKNDLLDVEVEAKMKNLAVLKMKTDFNIPI